MKFFTNIYARSYQKILYLFSAFINFREPTLIKGEKTIFDVPSLLKKNNRSKLLIVTDEILWSLGILKPLLNSLDKANFPYEVYHEVVSNPTTKNVEDGYKIYKKGNCDSLLAFGGGSAIDATKAIGIKVVKPNKTMNELKGVMKVRKNIPFMIAIPTTAGTGSETTVASVIVDKDKGDKYAINDPVLIPQIAILDPTLLVNLPKSITSTTGMDALTHAVEAFIGRSNTKRTKKYAIDATKLIFEYLEKSVNNPTNLEYRIKMQEASFEAGVAFTKAYVGTVHSLAHAIGGKYNIPHGLANSIILPITLKAYGKSADKKLAILAKNVGIAGNSNHDLAQKFIKRIEELNLRIGIENTFGKLIKEEDLDFLVNHAYKETVPLYPVPRILSKKELKNIYIELIKNSK